MGPLANQPVKQFIQRRTLLRNTQEEKKDVKRMSTEGAEASKLKIKSQPQLKEGTISGDFLSTIMPEQPKKRKIKLADLKAQKEVKGASDMIAKPDTEEKEDSMYSHLTLLLLSSASIATQCLSPEGDAKKEGLMSPLPQEEALVLSFRLTLRSWKVLWGILGAFLFSQKAQKGQEGFSGNPRRVLLRLNTLSWMRRRV